MPVRRLILSLAVLTCALIAVPAAFGKRGDTARYILPPGNYGGLPFTANSRDQLPLYSGLTPLRRKVSAADLRRHYLPENFTPLGQSRVEPTGRAGLRLVYDAYGIPHVYGKTRADVAFGAGWTTARDRGLLISLARGPARVAVADVPGIDAFSLVTSAKPFVPSKQAEAIVTRQRGLIRRVYGARKGGQILADAQNYADGINAYLRAHGSSDKPLGVNDVLAVTSFIGSIFGAGGGAEADNADLLAKLRRRLGTRRGTGAWKDVMLADDPEAPTTISKRFSYGPITGGRVRGSIVIDPGSIHATDPTDGSAAAKGATVNAAAAPPRRRASNFLVVAPSRSKTRRSLAVMGPQLGYYYPEIVQQIDLHGPGINAQGAAVPGLAMYILLGRTKNYAWSLTSSGGDVRDVFAERLCEPDGSKPTRTSTHYLFRGRCRASTVFDAGTLGGKPLRFRRTVHGPVIGTATVHGRPYALARRRSTFGRDGLNLAALKDMTDGKATTPQRFWRAANEFGFTFNWAYASRSATAYFSSGRLPVRARGLDRRLPTLGTGAFEWRSYLPELQHPHAVSGPGGILRNWNNRSAPGFMHGDDEPYGSAQRVELFNRFGRKVTLPADVGIMNRAASQDIRSRVWPEVRAVLQRGTAPNARAERLARALDGWVRRDAPRLDANGDKRYDAAGATIMDAVWPRVVPAVMRPVFGPLLSDLDRVRGLQGESANSYVDKDLRRLLGRRERGPFNLRYCGRGSLRACRRALWGAVDRSAADLARRFGSDDPARWRGAASYTGFVPGLLPDTFPTTNRPTFQQVLEFARP